MAWLQIIAQKDIPVPTGGSQGPFIVERPKVLFNPRTKKFVCWFHLDTAGYKFRHVGIFEADKPTGPFLFVHALQVCIRLCRPLGCAPVRRAPVSTKHHARHARLARPVAPSCSGR